MKVFAGTRQKYTATATPSTHAMPIANFIGTQGASIARSHREVKSGTKTRDRATSSDHVSRKTFETVPQSVTPALHFQKHLDFDASLGGTHTRALPSPRKFRPTFFVHFPNATNIFEAPRPNHRETNHSPWEAARNSTQGSCKW